MRTTRHSDFGLLPPPRAVPASVCVRVLFGGSLNQFGWCVFFVGSVVAWWLFPIDELIWQSVHAQGKLVSMPGVVLESAATGAEEGVTEVYWVTYAFTDREGVERRGCSYWNRRRLREGTAVTVEYPIGKPWVSKVQDMRRSQFGLLGGAVILLFPLSGLGISAKGMSKGFRAIRLLRGGQPTLASFVAKWETGTEYNERKIYQMTFDFTDADGDVHRTKFKSYKPEELDDGSKKALLYDPDNPADAVLLDDLPETPAFDGSGGIRPAPLGGVYRALFAPAAAFAGHGVYIYLAWIGQMGA